MLAFLKRFTTLNDVIQQLDVISFQSQRQADTIEATVTTIGLIIVRTGSETLFLSALSDEDWHTGQAHFPDNKGQYNRNTERMDYIEFRSYIVAEKPGEACFSLFGVK
jgi:hypothetical protein